MLGADRGLTAAGFGLRFLFSLLLVLLSYNPSGYSFVDWVVKGHDTALVYKVISGLILLIGWVIYVRATKNSLGPVGAGLSVALLACLVWLFAEWGWFDPKNLTAMTWVIEIILAAVLAIGMSWSHIRRRLSGQVDTDEIEG